MTNYQLNEKKSTKQKGLPIRYFLLFNSFFAFIIVYANKVVLSVAIVAMVRDKSLDHASMNNDLIVNSTILRPSFQALHSGSENNLNNNLNNNLTNLPKQLKESEPIIKHPHFTGLKSNQVDYDVKTKSKVLGAFFIGYIITQVPAGRLAERYGAKHLLGFSMFICSLLSLIIPVATLSEKEFANSKSDIVRGIHNFMYSIMGHAWALQLIRIVQGVCAGCAHPSMHALITRWTPKNERSMTTAFIYSGSQIGTVIIMPVTGFLASSTFLDGWPSVFYLLGVLGTVWFILWCIFVYDTPDKHPFISKEELEKLRIGIGNKIAHDNREIPWKKVFTSWPVYALIAAHFGQNFGYFMLLTELPTYLEGLNYDIESNGVISSLPYLVQAVTSWVASYISDRFVASEVTSLSRVRKCFNSIGFFGPAVCFVVIAFAGASRTIIILSLIFALALNGFAMSGFHVTHVDMAPPYAGTLMGITNGISNFNGIIAPFIVTALTDEITKQTEWWAVFLIGCAVYVITNLIYCWLGTSKLQTWAQTSTADKEIQNVFVCDNSHQNGKKDSYLLTDLKKDQHTLNGTTLPELKIEFNSKN